MVELTTQRATEIIDTESKNTQIMVEELGIPTVHHLYDEKVGVVHAYRKGETTAKVGYFLSIYNWTGDSVSKKASIKLFDVEYDETLFLISTLTYDKATDTVFIILTSIYGCECRLVELVLANQIEACEKTQIQDATLNLHVKCTLFTKMVTTLVTMHKSEGALFLLCQKKYYVFTREREMDPF